MTCGQSLGGRESYEMVKWHQFRDACCHLTNMIEDIYKALCAVPDVIMSRTMSPFAKFIWPLSLLVRVGSTILEFWTMNTCPSSSAQCNQPVRELAHTTGRCCFPMVYLISCIYYTTADRMTVIIFSYYFVCSQWLQPSFAVCLARG